jgi:hypothetical protein
MTATNKQWTPAQISDIDAAFPTDVSELMPSYRELPKEFTDRDSPYCDLVSTWFYRGLEKSKLRTKPGIDQRAAFRHLATVLQSWEPKHEHKMAGVAYLMSLWFDIV